MTASLPSRDPPPLLPMPWLDTLWLQVTGTVCNIACRHCFISCGPKVRIHEMMSPEQVRAALDQGRSLGVRAYYFTGGEPFLHPRIFDLIEWTLAEGPLGILTNGLLLDDEAVARLAELERASRYSLELRVSLDGLTAEQNDPVRGRGSFDAVTRAVARLAEAGLEPVLTVTEVEEGLAAEEARVAFADLLRSLGVRRPRLKFLPPLRIGREARRSRPYGEAERLAEGDLDAEAPYRLVCGTSRTVTERGVWTCPILVNDDSARLGESVADAMVPIQLQWSACWTCQVEGLRCAT